MQYSPGYAKVAYSLISVRGKDALRFLQAQTTSDVKALTQGAGQPSALLDRKAQIQAYFQLFRMGDEDFHIVAQTRLVERITNHLDSYIFADKVELGVLSTNACLVSGVEPPAGAYSMPLSPCASYIVFDQLPDLPLLSDHELEIRRIEAGTALMDTDYGDLSIVELSLSDAAVSYTKGCFLGQEVLARVKMQGTPVRQLVGLSIDACPVDVIEHGVLKIDGAAVGEILSNGYSERLSAHLALALMKREHRTPGKILHLERGALSFSARVELLPFISVDNTGRAREIYEDALAAYARGASEEAIRALKEAISLDNKMEDAYEALGVIISKSEGHSMREAIEVMDALVAINPDSVMAHTNLSVFWVELGDKEKAEEEKAISMSIRMRQAAKEAMQESRQREEKEKQVNEAHERMRMFAQVLEIDEDDLFANQGMGNCHNILGNHGEAVRYLQKAVKLKENHTQNYQELAEAYRALGDIEASRATLEKGIEVAARKGDMAPLKAMQESLAALASA